jgi:hypothetical protein
MAHGFIRNDDEGGVSFHRGPEKRTALQLATSSMGSTDAKDRRTTAYLISARAGPCDMFGVARATGSSNPAIRGLDHGRVIEIG